MFAAPQAVPRVPNTDRLRHLLTNLSLKYAYAAQYIVNKAVFSFELQFTFRIQPRFSKQVSWHEESYLTIKFDIMIP